MDPLAGPEITLGGERLRLLPDRALFWPARQILIVADIHFGKSAAFRHHGIAVPDGETETDLMRLTRLVEATAAAELIIAGDLLHAASSKTGEVTRAVLAWRQRHSDLRVILVSGNHDRSAGMLPADWNIVEAGRLLPQPPLTIVHDPADANALPPDTNCICGHLHPAVSLPEGRMRSAKAPSFWVRSREKQLVLPSFGSFTGSKGIKPGPDDRVFAVGRKVVEVAPGLLSPG